MPLVLTFQPSAHLWSQLQVWGMVPVHHVLVPASTETFNQGEREASGELERYFLKPPEVPTEQSSAVCSWHLRNTTSNGLVLPGPLSLLLCPVLWSHFPNKLLPLALGSFSASHAFRRALVKLLMKPISNYLFIENAGDRGTRSLLTQGVSNFPRMDDWYFNQIECLKIKDRREGGKKDKRGGREEERSLLQIERPTWPLSIYVNSVESLFE